MDTNKPKITVPGKVRRGLRHIKRIYTVCAGIVTFATLGTALHRLRSYLPDGTVLIQSTKILEGTDYAVLGAKDIPASRSMPGRISENIKRNGGKLSRGGWIAVKSFRIDEKQVSVGRYKDFVRDNEGMSMPEAPSWNPGWRNNDMPMVNITPAKAAEFAAWAGGTLPTYDQMIAASFNGNTEYVTGSSFDPTKIICSVDGSRNAPVPLSSAEAIHYKNEKGVYFAEGEVSVFTSDLFEASSDQQLVFGGSYRSDTAGDFRRSMRIHRNVWEGYEDVGMRVVHPIKETDINQ